MMSRILTAAPSLAFCVLLSSCASSPGQPAVVERQSIPLTMAAVSVNGRSLSFDVPSCGASPTASTIQDDGEIVITAEMDIQLGSDTESCQDELWVELIEPVAGRRVIDGSTGDEIALKQEQAPDN